ncbi:hypothetical protein BH09BAC5_BH09BAC5_12200 [soil metagenome]
MKFRYFILSVIFTGCIFSKPHFDEVRKTPKLKFETPPGTVWLHDNLFMDETEVRNLDYLEFLYWTNRIEPEKLKALLPDTLCWRNPKNYNEPYILYYLRHPSYRNYPVVGISYEQAVAFCKWRSDRVNEFIYIRENKVKDWKGDTTYPFKEIVRYRLPTKEEWEYAAAAGLNQNLYPFGYEKLTGKNGLPVSNTKEYNNLYNQNYHFEIYRNGDEGNTGSMNDAADITVPVYSFYPNKYGIFNMTGNVSEIIADTLFKGLNYETYLDGSTFKNDKINYQTNDTTYRTYDNRMSFKYQKPQAWLGFRCICEVLVEKGTKY